MSKFPLYDSLSKDISSTDLSASQKRSFLNKMDKLDQNGYDLVYALIRMYQVENGVKSTSFTLPYGGSFLEKDIKFDLDKFPNDLKHILYKFIGIHLKKMKDEYTLVKQTPVRRV